VRDLVDGDHAAAGRSGSAEQPGSDADQETRFHPDILAAATLRQGKEHYKVVWVATQTTQIAE
jgi:hypothetical protein